MSDSNVLAYTNTAAPPPKWALWLMTPIGWPTHAAFVLLGMILLWSERIPSGFSLTLLAEYMGSVALLVWTLLRVLLRKVLRRTYRQTAPDNMAAGRRLVLPIAMTLMVPLLLAFGIPQWAAWRISKPVLQRIADDIMANPPAAPATGDPVRFPARWAGVYHLSEVSYLPRNHGVRVFLKGAGFLDRIGFAYFPDAVPQNGEGPGEGATYLPWDGNWYKALENW